MLSVSLSVVKEHESNKLQLSVIIWIEMTIGIFKNMTNLSITLDILYFVWKDILCIKKILTTFCWNINFLPFIFSWNTFSAAYHYKISWHSLIFIKTFNKTVKNVNKSKCIATFIQIFLVILRKSILFLQPTEINWHSINMQSKT